MKSANRALRAAEQRDRWASAEGAKADFAQASGSCGRGEHHGNRTIGRNARSGWVHSSAAHRRASATPPTGSLSANPGIPVPCIQHGVSGPPSEFSRRAGVIRIVTEFRDPPGQRTPALRREDARNGVDCVANRFPLVCFIGKAALVLERRAINCAPGLSGRRPTMLRRSLFPRLRRSRRPHEPYLAENPL